MPATKTQPIARENYLAAVDELVARLGKDAALLFMRQAASAVDGKPSPMSKKAALALTTRMCSDVFADALEAAQP